MRLSLMISEILSTIDREAGTALNARALFWIQGAIDLVYATLPKEERQRTETLTCVTSQQWLDIPSDFGGIINIKDSSNQYLNYLTPELFFDRSGYDSAEGTSRDYTVWDSRFLFNPIPDSAISLKALYHLDRPNIYTHNLTIEHVIAGTIASDYVQVYIDEDALKTGEGKLLFVSPTTSDSKVWIQSVDGHKHEITVYHDANAATHPAWWFDEGASNAWERNFFISPTLASTVTYTSNIRRHHHLVNFIHNPDPTTFPDGNNAKVYIDEDNVDRGKRLAFTSPTTTDGTCELTHAKEGVFPGFLERYQQAIYNFALAEGHSYNKNPGLAKYANERAAALLSMVTGSNVNEEQAT